MRLQTIPLRLISSAASCVFPRCRPMHLSTRFSRTADPGRAQLRPDAPWIENIEDSAIDDDRAGGPCHPPDGGCVMDNQSKMPVTITSVTPTSAQGQKLIAQVPLLRPVAASRQRFSFRIEATRESAAVAPNLGALRECPRDETDVHKRSVARDNQHTGTGCVVRPTSEKPPVPRRQN